MSASAKGYDLSSDVLKPLKPNQSIGQAAAAAGAHAWPEHTSWYERLNTWPEMPCLAAICRRRLVMSTFYSKLAFNYSRRHVRVSIYRGFRVSGFGSQPAL